MRAINIARDLGCPLTTPNHPIFYILHCHEDLKFGIYLLTIASPTLLMKKYSLKRAWSRE